MPGIAPVITVAALQVAAIVGYHPRCSGGAGCTARSTPGDRPVDVQCILRRGEYRGGRARRCSTEDCHGGDERQTDRTPGGEAPPAYVQTTPSEARLRTVGIGRSWERPRSGWVGRVSRSAAGGVCGCCWTAAPVPVGVSDIGQLCFGSRRGWAWSRVGAPHAARRRAVRSVETTGCRTARMSLVPDIGGSSRYERYCFFLLRIGRLL